MEVDDPLCIKGDRLSLTRLIENLVDNSVKYGLPDSPIRIRGFVAGDVVTIKVSDSGPGIPAEHIDRVFDRFYRVDESRTSADAPAGAGLGLNICRGIVEAHRGQIRITSKEGLGTTVTVQFACSHA